MTVTAHNLFVWINLSIYSNINRSRLEKKEGKQRQKSAHKRQNKNPSLLHLTAVNFASETEKQKRREEKRERERGRRGRDER